MILSNIGWAQLGNSSGLGGVHSRICRQMLIGWAAVLLGARWMSMRTSGLTKQHGLSPGRLVQAFSLSNLAEFLDNKWKYAKSPEV